MPLLLSSALLFLLALSGPLSSTPTLIFSCSAAFVSSSRTKTVASSPSFLFFVGHSSSSLSLSNSDKNGDEPSNKGSPRVASSSSSQQELHPPTPSSSSNPSSSSHDTAADVAISTITRTKTTTTTAAATTVAAMKEIGEEKGSPIPVSRDSGADRGGGGGAARLLPYLSRALEALGVSVPEDDPRLASMATLIEESMSTECRLYHALEHVFDLLHLLGEDDPIVVLAVLFHDVVYVNVDGGLSPRQASVLHGIAPSHDDDDDGAPHGYRIVVNDDDTDGVDDDDGVDDALRLVTILFDCPPGHTLRPATGVNEFLSAAVAVRELATLVPLPILAQIATCIEATFPFRARESAPVTPMELLYERLGVANDVCHLNLTEPDRVQAVQRALMVINEADLNNFGEPDVASFLSKTWDLLPETNPALRHPLTYTVAEYAVAVQKMIGLFDFLTPTIIFQEFRGFPSPDRLATLRANARHNIDCARLYLRSMLLGLSVLSAFLHLAGGGSEDTPMHRILGDPQSPDCLANRLPATTTTKRGPVLLDPANTSTTTTTTTTPACEEHVFDLLCNGRSCDSAFDVRQAPLAAHLLAHFGPDAVHELCQSTSSVLYPMRSNDNDDTTAAAWTLLRRLPPATVTSLGSTLIDAFPGRAAALRPIVEALQ